jgi:tetratricopeptide (TPR) repeat protein
MRKINVKLFLGLLIGTLVLTGAVFAVHYFQSPRIAQSLLWQAQRAEEQGDVERTARYLERYLEFNPRDQKERARLGSLLAGEQFAALPRRRLKGVNLLDDVLTADPGRDDLRLVVVKTCLDLRNRQLARSHLDKLWSNANAPGASTPPEKLAELELLWGRLLEGENKPEEAIAKYRDAVRHAKGEPDASLRLAFLLRGLAEKDALNGDANREEADRVMDLLVEANPESYKSYLFRWRYRRDFNLLALGSKPEKGKVPLAKAADDVAAALGHEREKVEVLLAKADLERLLANAAAEDPALENREAEAGKHRKLAREVLEEGLRLQEKAGYRDASDAALFQLLWHLVHLQFEEYPADPKASEATRAAALKAIEGTLERIARTRAIPATVDYLKGRLLLVKGQWAGAADLLEKARPALAPQRELAAQIDLFLGQCYERLENAAQMYEAYKRVNDWDPASVTAYLGMGAAQWMMGRLDEAADNFGQALKAERVPAQAWLDFARLEIQRQRLKDKPDWRGALDALGRAEKLDGKSVDLTLARAQLHLVRGEADKAEALLQGAANGQPEEAQYWAALIALADRNNDAAKAAQYLKQGQSRAGDKVLLRLARAGLLARGKDGKAARESINQLLQGIETMSPEDQAQLLNGLGAAQYQAGNVDEARRLWTRMCELPRYRNDMRLRLLLFDLALQQGEGVHQALDDIRDLEKGHGGFHRYGNALRLTWEAKKGTKDRKQALDEARQELDFARRQQPRWPAPCLALAEIDDLTGNPEGAIKNLRDAIDLGETSPPVVKRLVNALYRQNRVAEANQEIKKLQRLTNQGDDLLNLIALSYVLDKNPAEAVKTIEAAKGLGSNDFNEYLSRGLIYDMAGKRTEAEQNLRKAVALAEKEPAPWVGLVRFLAAHGGDAVARTEMEKARKSLPPEKVNLTLAQCYEALGLNKDALKYYRLALEERRNDTATVREVASFLLRNGQLEEAKQLLKSIAEGRTQAGDADREWARRGLAIVLSSGTDYRDFRAALELVGVKLDDNGLLARPEKGGDRSENTESQRVRARVLATQPQRQFRERAIELLQDLRVRGALTPDDQFVLALLLEAQGAKQQSFDQIEALVKSQADQPQFLSQGQTPQYLAKYVQMLLRQGQLEQAGRWIDEIEKLERQREVQPNDYLSVELRARLLEARNQGDKAIALLRAHADRRNARPEDILLIVASLGRQKKFAAALDVCESAWRTKCPPEYLGGACVSLLREMGPTDAQLRRVEGWITDAIRKRDQERQANPKAPRSSALTMHLADLYDLRGRYDEAEKLYKAVLREEPNNVVALNNLAWLLAQRQQNGAEAKPLIETAVQGVGRQPHLLDTRGLVHLALGQNEAAVADFQEAVKDSPNPTRLFHLARAYHRAGDKDNAARVLREAAQQGLRPEKLHPIEQGACTSLLNELKVKIDRPAERGT